MNMLVDEYKMTKLPIVVTTHTIFWSVWL